jgi:hypothetical protein
MAIRALFSAAMLAVLTGSAFGAESNDLSKTPRVAQFQRGGCICVTPTGQCYVPGLNANGSVCTCPDAQGVPGTTTQCRSN